MDIGDRLLQSIVVGAALAIGATACGASSLRTSSTTGASSITATRVSQAVYEPTQAGLRAAAIDYANAFLKGAYRDLIAVLDPGCVPKGQAELTARIALGDTAFRNLRVSLKQHTGIDPASLAITVVDIRDFTPTTGEAETQYGLPVSVEGNSNWNSYAFSGGRWHIDGCPMQFPIGGQSSEGSSVSATSTAS